MNKITTLSDDSDQTMGFLLADGSQVQFTFHYKLTVQRWFVDVSYKTFKAQNIGLSTHPNLLRVWRNTLPFGLLVWTADSTDPFMLEDFVSGRVMLYVLDSTNGGTDVADIERQYYGG